MESAIYLGFLALLPLLFFLKRAISFKRVPPGSLGIPIIGQSLQLLKAMRANRGEEWLQQRARKYGPISKLHIFGTPTVFLHGQSANKFIYTADENTLSSKQPTSIRRLFGENNLFELNEEDHKRLRGAFSSFLKPEALKQYVGKMDEEIRMHLNEHWHHNKEILVMDGALALPINLPFTRFGKSLRARYEAGEIIRELIHEKREKLAKRKDSNQQPDLITSLLSIRDHETNSPVLSDQEIIDNCVLAMIAGHDTTSILLTFLVKLLAENRTIYETILDEQEEIGRGKGEEEALTWDDVVKMKYTWRVVTETLRMYPPVIFGFRQVLKDIEMGGYIIPKGWQVFWAACMTHMDESLFSDPYKFNPSRYETQAAPPYAFMAFGGGARMCPGYEFARIETLTMIHYLVTRFQWTLSLKENTMSIDPIPLFKEGLPIRIEVKKMMQSN